MSGLPGPGWRGDLTCEVSRAPGFLLAPEDAIPDYLFPGIRVSSISDSGIYECMQRSLGFVAVQARGGAITIPAEARRALRLDAPGAQVEVILRDHDLLLIPHVAVPLEQAQGRPGQPGPQ